PAAWASTSSPRTTQHRSADATTPASGLSMDQKVWLAICRISPSTVARRGEHRRLRKAPWKPPHRKTVALLTLSLLSLYSAPLTITLLGGSSPFHYFILA